MGQSVLRDRKTPFRNGGNVVLQPKCMPVSYRKGIGLIFPNLATEIGPSGSSAATQKTQETSAGAPGRVLFSL